MSVFVQNSANAFECLIESWRFMRIENDNVLTIHYYCGGGGGTIRCIFFYVLHFTLHPKV